MPPSPHRSQTVHAYRFGRCECIRVGFARPIHTQMKDIYNNRHWQPHDNQWVEYIPPRMEDQMFFTPYLLHMWRCSSEDALLGPHFAASTSRGNAEVCVTGPELILTNPCDDDGKKRLTHFSLCSRPLSPDTCESTNWKCAHGFHRKLEKYVLGGI